MFEENICELAKIIPKENLCKVFEDNPNACAELDCTFLGFEDVYKSTLLYVPKSKIILDFGCAYGMQSYFFLKYKKYIGIDIEELKPLNTKNSEFYTKTSIQKFISDILPTLGYKLTDFFAICSYVPDKEARELVRKTFPNCLVYYPCD